MKALFLAVFLTFSSGAFAADERDVQNLIESCQSALVGKGNWSWSLIRVRVILEMGIEVPVLASFSVNPEVELYFTKK